MLHPAHWSEGSVWPLSDTDWPQIAEQDWPSEDVLEEHRSTLKVRNVGPRGLELAHDNCIPLLCAKLTPFEREEGKALIRICKCVPWPEPHTWLVLIDERNDIEDFIESLGAAGAVRPDLLGDGWKLKPKIGKGTFSLVFRLAKEDPNESRPKSLAIKVHAYRPIENEGPHRHIRQEVEILVAVQGHENVLLLRGLMQTTVNKQAVWATVHDQYKCGSLYERCNGIPCSESQAKTLFKGLLAGLEHIHRAGVVHRDMKIDNIFLVSQSHAVIGDFGSACFLVDSREMAKRVGSVGYSAPELWLQQLSYNEKVDVFGLGVCLCFAVIGRHPFGSSDAEMNDGCVRGAEGLHKSDFRYKSADFLNFVVTLLESDPSCRPSASSALKLKWLADAQPPELTVAPRHRTAPCMMPPEAQEASPTSSPSRWNLFGHLKRTLGLTPRLGSNDSADSQALPQPSNTTRPLPVLSARRPAGPQADAPPPGARRTAW